MTQQDDFEELLGAYALDACEPDEAEAIARHLPDCPRCRAELAAHLEVAGSLGNLGGAAPEGLWDRIWGEIGSTTGEAATPATGGRSAAGGGEAPSLPPFAAIDGGPRRADFVEADSGGARSLRHRSAAAERARRRWAFAIVAGAAAAALAVAVGVLGTTVGNLNNQVSALNKAVIVGGVRGAEQAALANPQHKTVQLTSSTGEWKAQLVVLPGGQAFIVPEKMPAISSASTFQAWAVVHGEPVSLGVLGRSAEVHQLLLQPNMTAILVNTEPLGGSSRPTTAALVKSDLPTTL